MRMIFKPDPPAASGKTRSFHAGDRTDGEVYCYTEELTFAVNVALAARRPLLVTGPSGCGKSSLARDIARVLKWRYLEQVISSRTQAQDLLWRFDSVRRLSDGAAGTLDPENDHRYIEPGVLWWAFQPETATQRGQKGSITEKDRPVPPYPKDGQTDPTKPAVVLIDEIDKADPDVPNALLVPIGSYTFRVDGIEAPVEVNPDLRPPLIVITSNGERDLPAAFRRRCVEFTIGAPDKRHLRAIAVARFGKAPAHSSLCEAILDRITNPETPNERSGTGGHHINTAQFLDAIHASLDLQIDASAELDKVMKVLETVWPTSGGAS